MGIESIDVAGAIAVEDVSQTDSPAAAQSSTEVAGSVAVAYHGGALDQKAASSAGGFDVAAAIVGVFKPHSVSEGAMAAAAIGTLKPHQCGTAAQQGALFDLGAILGDVIQFALGLLASQQPRGSVGAEAGGRLSAASSGTWTAGGAAGRGAAATRPPPSASQGQSVPPRGGRSLAPDIEVIKPSGPQSALEKRGAAAQAQLAATEIPADISYSDGAKVSIQGQETVGPLCLSGEASAHEGVNAKAGASAKIDGNGLTAMAGAEAVASVGVEASGAITSDVGSIAGHAEATAEAYARAKAMAHLGTTGGEAAALAEVGADAKVEADAKAEVLGGLVKGSAVGVATTGTGATAKGDVALSYDPLEAAVDGTAEAFAGSRAGFSAKGGIAGAAYTIAAEAWAGAGAKAEFKGGYRDGVFKFQMGVGVAVGVGAFVEIGFEFDTRDAGHFLGSLFGAIGNLAGGVVGGAVHIAGGAVDGVFGAVGGVFGGKGAHAGDVVTSFLDSLVPQFLKPAAVAGVCS